MSSTSQYPSALTWEDVNRANAARDAPTDPEAGGQAPIPMPMSSDSFDAEFVCPAWVPGPVRAFSSATLGVIDVVGGKLADWFGLTTPRYAEYIDEAVEEGQRHQKYLIEKSVGRTNAPVTGEQVVNVMPGFSEIPLMAPPSSALLPQQKGPSTAVAGSGGASRNFSQV